MRRALTVARLDLAVWWRTPWAIAAALIPPLGMFILVHVLSLSVTEQPVALVINDPGRQAKIVADFIKADNESYGLIVTDEQNAHRLLDVQKVAAIIEIPAGFERDIAAGRASLSYVLNNVDIDFADDIRRSVDRSVAQYDAPQLGSSVQGHGDAGSFVVPNPYRVDIEETRLRDTAVPFETYQVMPVLLLLIISVGVLNGAMLGTRDRERRTHRFLATTPLSRTEFVIGRVLGTFTAILFILVPVVELLWWRGTIDPPHGHWPAFLAVLGETMVLAAGLGVLLGIVFRGAATVALAAIITSSYLFFLGGGFTTIAFLPAWLRALSRFVPTRYAIDGLRQTLFYGDLAGMQRNLVYLGAFALGSLVLGVGALRRQAR